MDDICLFVLPWHFWLNLFLSLFFSVFVSLSMCFQFDACDKILLNVWSLHTHGKPKYCLLFMFKPLKHVGELKLTSSHKLCCYFFSSIRLEVTVITRSIQYLNALDIRATFSFKYSVDPASVGLSHGFMVMFCYWTSLFFKCLFTKILQFVFMLESVHILKWFPWKNNEGFYHIQPASKH